MCYCGQQDEEKSREKGLVFALEKEGKGRQRKAAGLVKEVK